MKLSRIFGLELETFTFIYGWFCAIFSSFGIIVSSTLFPLGEDHLMGVDKTCKLLAWNLLNAAVLSPYFYRLQSDSILYTTSIHFVVCK